MLLTVRYHIQIRRTSDPECRMPAHRFIFTDLIFSGYIHDCIDHICIHHTSIPQFHLLLPALSFHHAGDQHPHTTEQTDSSSHSHSVRHIRQNDLMTALCEGNAHQCLTDAVRLHLLSVHKALPVPVIRDRDQQFTAAIRLYGSRQSSALRRDILQRRAGQFVSHFFLQRIRTGVDDCLRSRAIIDCRCDRGIIAPVTCLDTVEMIGVGRISLRVLRRRHTEFFDPVGKRDVDLLSFRYIDLNLLPVHQVHIAVQRIDRVMAGRQ